MLNQLKGSAMKLNEMLRNVTTIGGVDKRGNIINETPAESELPALIKAGKGTFFLKRTVTRADAESKVAQLNAVVNPGRVWRVGETKAGGLYLVSDPHYNDIVVDGQSI